MADVKEIQELAKILNLQNIADFAESTLRWKERTMMNRLRQIGRDKKQYLSSDYDFWPDYVFWTCFILLLIIDCVENTSVIYSEPFWPKGRYLFRNCL